MKRAVLYGPRDLRLEEFSLETDQLGPNDVWVETQITALKIGTDRGNYEGAEQVPGAPDFPRWVGDSSLGVVRAVGREVARFSPGDRVFARKSHQSDYIATESEAIVKIPEDVASEDAVYLGLYHVSALSYWRAHYQAGENVAVIGVGLLGLADVALGRAFGARVIAVGNSRLRLEMAEKMGADLTVMSDDPNLSDRISEFTGKEGVDLVILTANPWPAYRVAMDVVRFNGRVAILGLPGRGESSLDFNPLDMEWFYAKSLTLIAASMPVTSFYPVDGDRFDLVRSAPTLLKLMAQGVVEPKRLITDRLACERIQEAYEMAYRREKSMMGVLFKWH